MSLEIKGVEVKNSAQHSACFCPNEDSRRIPSAPGTLGDERYQHIFLPALVIIVTCIFGYAFYVTTGTIWWFS